MEIVDPEDFQTRSAHVEPSALPRTMIRAEAELVLRFRRWLDPRHDRLRAYVIRVGDRMLRADLFDPIAGVLIEAKADAGRDSLRYGVGQLYLTTGATSIIALLLPCCFHRSPPLT